MADIKLRRKDKDKYLKEGLQPHISSLHPSIQTLMRFIKQASSGSQPSWYQVPYSQPKCLSFILIPTFHKPALTTDH